MYPTSIVVWYFFLVLGFHALLYCVYASESEVYVLCLKKLVIFPNFGLWYVSVALFFSYFVILCCIFLLFLLCVY